MEKRAVVIFIAASAVLLIPAILIKPNAFFIMPLLSIAANISALYLVSKYMKKSVKELLFTKDRVISTMSWLLVLNIIYASVTVLLRTAPDFKTAMYWSIILMASTYAILLGLVYLTLIFPNRIFTHNLRAGISHTLFFLLMLFLVPTYVFKILSHGYAGDVGKVYGVFPELTLMKEIIGGMSPVFSVISLFVMATIPFLSTYQFLHLKNPSIRRYYSIMWIILVVATAISIFIVFVLGAIMSGGAFMGYSIESMLFAPAVTYSLARVYSSMKSLENLHPGMKPRGYLEVYAMDEKPVEAKKALFSRIKDGRSAIVFSREDEDEFFPGKKPDSVVYVQVDDKGYRIGSMRFRSIDDIVNSDEFPADISGLIVYVHTMPENESDVPGPERLIFYNTIRDMMKSGALVIAPVIRRHLNVKKDSVRTQHPTWIIKPVMVLRLEEAVNILFSGLSGDKKRIFLGILKDIGVPLEHISDEHISLDMHRGMGLKAFSEIILEMKKRAVRQNLVDPEDFDEKMRILFRENLDDYDAIVRIHDREMYLINGDKPEKEAMEKALSLAMMGRSLLIISRTNPEILKSTYSMEGNIEIKWMTNMPGKDDVVTPHLESVKKVISDFMDENENSAVLLDGIEYLMRIHGFRAILDLLWILKDRVAEKTAVVLIPVNLGSMDKKDAETLKREFTFL